MKSKTKLRVVITIVAVFILGITLFTISNNLSRINANSKLSINTKEFSEADAISKLLKEHPDFPANPAEVITKKLGTGGPQGSTANVKFSYVFSKPFKGPTYKLIWIKFF